MVLIGNFPAHTGAGIKIGHLDTGVDTSHPALAGRVAAFQKFSYRGRPEGDKPAHDSGWHGTHTAGLLVGDKVDGRCLGVAPAAKLCSGMVVETGNIVARILAGLDWLISCQVRVVNLAIGISGQSPIFRPLIQEMVKRDMVVVVSIGNKGVGKGLAPGIYPEVISVGAVDADGRVPKFSGSYHHFETTECHKPDLLAPGVDILSTIPGGQTKQDSGTSMATALVAGLVATMLSAYPQATVGVIKRALIESCDPRRVDQDHRSVNGKVNPSKAFAWLENWAQNPVQINLVDEPWAIEAPIPETFVDPRLKKLLHLKADSNLCDAVFYFKDWESLERFKKVFERDPDRMAGRGELQSLKHAPYVICQATRKFMLQVLSCPDVRYGSACDIDRTLLL